MGSLTSDIFHLGCLMRSSSEIERAGVRGVLATLPLTALCALFLAAAFAPVCLDAVEKRSAAAPPLEREHSHPSGAFTFRTPADWTVELLASSPGTQQASRGELLVRFIYRAGEAGYDSLHVTCMLERLAGPMEMEPDVRYEYDFLSGTFGHLRVLDSAFLVRYDEPILGHKEWRQRNFTLVGGGHSLCAIAHAPAKVWKKSRETRSLLDAIVASIVFLPRP